MLIRAGFKIILGISVIAVAAVVGCYFLADFQFNSAKKLESAYQWQKAEERYRLATKLDSFNAEYLAGYGDFLREKSAYQKDKTGWLERAGKLYARALKLDPRNAEYALRLGQEQLALFLLDKYRFKDDLAYGFNSLKRAIENDPNDADMNYAVGYTGMSVWEELNVVEKKWVLDRLHLSLKIKPWYEEGIYPRLWQLTKDPMVLRQVRPVESAKEKQEKLKRIERIKQGGLGQSWQGKSRDGDIYENGNMYWTGTVDRAVDMPAGKVTIKIQAKGSPAWNIWPYMIVELDGEEIGEAVVDSQEWKDYSFPIDTGSGIKVLSVTYTNDACNPARNEDRNLFLGDIRVEKP
jgi:tetratricopeptide (TPR) repeat protein